MSQMDVDLQTIPVDKDAIVNYLTGNNLICFKSQQKDDTDLSVKEKIDIASEIFDKNKLIFLTRFGRYLQEEHLVYFKQFADESDEISALISDLLSECKNDHRIKNRRYKALQELIEGDKYFSEIEMMKRNPLLYEQLVGRYLSEDEKKERDKYINEDSMTFVKILMEGIERNDAETRRQEQENIEDEDEEIDDNTVKPTCSQWGEFSDAPKRKPTTNNWITDRERKLLRNEFVTTMYQNFLEGKDEDFNYATVDKDEKYDDTEVKARDDEDRYFDSEEPDDAVVVDVSSEDELDIYMNALNQHPTVCQLSEDIQRL